MRNVQRRRPPLAPHSWCCRKRPASPALPSFFPSRILFSTPVYTASPLWPPTPASPSPASPRRDINIPSRPSLPRHASNSQILPFTFAASVAPSMPMAFVRDLSPPWPRMLPLNPVYTYCQCQRQRQMPNANSKLTDGLGGLDRTATRRRARRADTSTSGPIRASSAISWTLRGITTSSFTTRSWAINGWIIASGRLTSGWTRMGTGSMRLSDGGGWTGGGDEGHSCSEL